MPWPCDPVLRELEVLEDLTAIGARFTGWEVTRRLHARYSPRASCVATYELVPTTGGSPTIGVVGMHSGGVTTRLFVDDPALPWLPIVTDPVEVAHRLGTASCAVTPVRYRPGARCTVRIDGGGGTFLFAKMLRRGGGRLRAIGAALRDVAVGVPNEAAWWDDAETVVYDAVPGSSSLGASLPLEPDLAATAGRALARLHRPDVVARVGRVAGDPVSVGDDVASLDRLRPAVAHATPQLLAHFDRARATVASAHARSTAAAPTVLGHGAFRASQVHLDRAGRAVLLDLDGVAPSEPARDVGNFLANLAWQALRDPAHAGALRTARDAFLDGYGSTCALPDPCRLQLCQAVSTVKIAGRRVRDISTHEWPILPDLLESALDDSAQLALS